MIDADDTPFAVGFSRVTVGDPDTGERITAGIWYPTKSREARVSEQSRTFMVARDAMPAPGSYPLILLSHGSGAWYGAHHDSAEFFARRGFITASLTHPGDNFQDLSGYLGARQLLGRPHHMKLLADLARNYLPANGAALSDPVLRDRIAQNEMDTRAFGLTVQRARDAAKAGHQPGSESSLVKVYATELNQARYELMMQIAGPQALGWEGEGFDPGELDRTREWLRSRGNTIEGGTSEVQRNIIAKHVLGLPD